MPLSAQQLAAQKNLSYVLAEKLAQRILAGKYAPGSILPGEMELGEQFGVSRTAVREAVKTLTAKGMVLLVMRSSLEPQACLLAATLGTAEQKAQLNALMEEMVFLKKHFNRERWVEVDMAWHEHIYMMSANPFLTSFASLFHSVYHTYFTSITQDDVVKLEWHQAIVDAIQESDGQRALSACQALLAAPTHQQVNK